MTATSGGVNIVLLDAHDLYRVKSDAELGLRVFLTRRVMHTLFNGKALSQYPLTVTLRDRKTGTDRLVNLSLREEYYGRIPVWSALRKAEAAARESLQSPRLDGH